MADKTTRISQTNPNAINVNEARPRTVTDPEIADRTKPNTTLILINHEELVRDPSVPTKNGTT